MRRGALAWALLAGMVLAAPGARAQPGHPAERAPSRPMAPAFHLPDTAGVQHTLAQWRGRPVVVFFFCGCAPCHACAHLWRQIEDSETPPPRTVLVFTGDAAGARQFDTQTGLDAVHAVTLTDPQERVSSAYGVTVCPRVFVLDAQGGIRYTNNAPGTDPQTTPAVSIDSTALTAWRAATPIRRTCLFFHVSGTIDAAGQGSSPASPSAPQTAPALTVVPDPAAGVTRAADGAGVWDAGSVDPMQHATIMQTFTLRNDGAQPMTISTLRAACGCTTLLADHALPETILPAQTAQVRVTLRMTGQPATTLHKFAWLYGPSASTAANSAIPLATLAINVTVRPAAALSPAYVDFGTVAQGAEHSMEVTVTVDKAALTQTPFPALVCTNSAVQVTPQRTPQPTMRDGLPALAQTFTVTLTPNAPVGPIMGRLLLRGEAATPTVALTNAGASVLPLFDVSDEVGGRVAGQLTATPSSVFFGSLPAGHAVTRTIIITAASVASAQNLTAASGSRWLSVLLRPSTPDRPSARLLEITISAQAPAGPLQAEVTVQDASGQRLSLPVLADLVSAP